MSVEVIQNLNKVATPQIKKYIAEVHQGTSASVSVTDIGLAKGDLIGFRGAGDPVRIQAGGINGRVLMVDSTKESGWAVAPVSGSSQSVTLHNGLGEIIPGGTIVKISSGYEMAKATSEDTTMLFVTSEDCDDDADVVCYGTANTIVSIRCTEDAVAVGDQLGVSSTDGVAETVETNGFARAITAKAGSTPGSVNAVIAQAGFLPLTGGTITGDLEISGTITAKASTPSSGDSSTKLATTAFVQGELSKEIMYFTSQAVSVASNAQIMRIPSSGTNDKITTNTVVLECTFAKPNHLRSDVTWTSYSGYIVFTGTCVSATTANVTLGKKGN